MHPIHHQKPVLKRECDKYLELHTTIIYPSIYSSIYLLNLVHGLIEFACYLNDMHMCNRYNVKTRYIEKQSVPIDVIVSMYQSLLMALVSLLFCVLENWVLKKEVCSSSVSSFTCHAH